jgi:hypothetical protein
MKTGVKRITRSVLACPCPLAIDTWAQNWLSPRRAGKAAMRYLPMVVAACWAAKNCLYIMKVEIHHARQGASDKGKKSRKVGVKARCGID